MDFKKVPTLDPIVKQHTPSYTVTKGCLSVSNVKFSSLTSSSSSASYNLQVPSLNVFMDRKIPWTSEFVLKCTLTHGDFAADEPGNAGNPAVDTPIASTLGQDLAPNSFPAHRLVNTATAAINDTVSTINMSDVLNEIVTLNDLRPDEEVNYTCPSFISRYAEYKDGYGAVNSSLTGFYDQVSGFKPSNGTYHDYSFCNENGGNLPDGNINLQIDGTEYKFISREPVATTIAYPAVVANDNIRTVYRFFIRVRSTEYLMLPPFIFNYDKLDSTGIFGVNNAQLTLNFKPNPENALFFYSLFRED